MGGAMSSVVIAGDTSGAITLSAPAEAGSGVITLPVATDTLVGKNTTDTLTNKTLTAPVIATIVNSGTLTLPTATGTLISTTGGVTPGTAGNLLVSSGSAWTSVAAPAAASAISTIDVKLTGTAATFTIPAGVTKMKVTVVGGGGSGATGNAGGSQEGAGGGAAGYALVYLTGLTPGNTLTYTVGAGGAAGGTTAPLPSGGTSSLSSGTQTITTVTCTGGATSVVGVADNALGGTGGTATNGTLNINGARGNPNGYGGSGGATPFGGAGGGATYGGEGDNATGYGSGGGGGQRTTGGAGKAGIIIFEY